MVSGRVGKRNILWLGVGEEAQDVVVGGGGVQGAAEGVSRFLRVSCHD